ncbi:hypothetical protein KFE94_02330 [bacterium SCSIO 12643]|nr:hypothetical protein KFE94_02330 [bacterium SCSIO 12643]
MTELFHTELKNDRISVNPKLKLLLAIAGIIVLINLNDLLISLVGSSICVVLIIISIFQLGKRHVIILTAESLYYETWIFGQRFIDTYHISEIKDLMYRKFVKSDLETTAARQKVFGVDVTPDSSRTFYIHPEIVQFSYQGKTISIGKYKEEFGGQKLFDLITELQNE